MFFATPAFANVENSKWVTNYTSSYYDDGTYSGYLTKYLAGGEYIPSDSKYVTIRQYGMGYSHWVCTYNSKSKYGQWSIVYKDETDRGQTYYYNEGGYTGTLYRYSTVKYRDDGNPTDPCTSANNGHTYDETKLFYADFGGTVTKPAQDTRYYRYQGYVYAVVDDPTASHKYSDSSGGSVDGEFSWKLEKSSDTSDSIVRLINSATISGNHYATRNPSYSISSSGVVSQSSSSPINITIDEPNKLKDKNISYDFSYEYTNYYKDIYTCDEYNSKGCISWSFAYRIPDWEKVKTASRSETLKGDHQYGETVSVSDKTSKSFVVGRTATLNGTFVTKSANQETFNIDASDTTLQSQTWIPIDEQIKYSSDLGNKLYVRDGDKWFFPNDIDENLRSKYKNETKYDLSKYAIPLRVGNKSNNAVTFNTADNFYLTENQGFQFSLPADEISISVINSTAKKEFEEYTGQTYDDTLLTTSQDGSRYYLNIDGNGDQKTDTWYDNQFVLGKLGLNDLTFQLKEKIRFKQYLLGNAVDKPLINEQEESVIKNMNYTHSVKISSDQMKAIQKLADERSDLLFGFRSTDIHDKYNQLKEILPSLSY